MSQRYPTPPRTEEFTDGEVSRETISESVQEARQGLLSRLDLPLFIGKDEQGAWRLGDQAEAGDLVGMIPAVTPDRLGDPAFCRHMGIKYPYLAGAMANGIASEELVIAMARSGMLGFFGAAGLDLDRITQAVDRIQAEVGDLPHGLNLIHAPHETRWEEDVVDLLLDRGVRLVEASAFLTLTPAIVRYRLAGIHEDEEGRVVAPNRVVAKISRVEVAEKFLRPAPDKMLADLVARGALTEHQAQLAKKLPVADHLTAEADSGGHTDNRPAIALLPTIIALRDRIQAEMKYQFAPRVGLAGGISTPAAAAAAFAMGAAFVLTGSVNQACVESGTSDMVRQMLAGAGQADIAMAPAADMFEMGVNVQVLKRGTMFPMRAAKLFELYRKYPSLDALTEKERATLEKTTFKAPLDEIWRQTKAFFSRRDPAQIERAERDPKHLMALVFRWYLGQSSGWANRGLEDRKVDFQVWCGPAMGAFNEWVRHSFLERPENRRIVDVAHNILFGTAYLTRLNQLRLLGYPVPADWYRVTPREPQFMKEHFS